MAPFQSPLLLGWVQGNKGRQLMKDKYSSRFGNNCSENHEGKMSSVALQDAVRWTENLMNAAHKGRGDKEYLARHRVSEDTGVSERYLYRLLYQRKGMKDVAGEAYRLLSIAHQKYEAMCRANEAAAERMRTERLELRKQHEADRKPAEQAVGMDPIDD